MVKKLFLTCLTISILCIVSCNKLEPGKMGFVSVNKTEIFSDADLKNRIRDLYFLNQVKILEISENSSKQEVCKIEYNSFFEGKNTCYILSKSLKPIEKASRIKIKYGSKLDYSKAVEKCQNSICGENCDDKNNDCKTDFIQLLEYGWTPPARIWIEAETLQMLIYEGRGPKR